MTLLFLSHLFYSVPPSCVCFFFPSFSTSCITDCSCCCCFAASYSMHELETATHYSSTHLVSECVPRVARARYILYMGHRRVEAYNLLSYLCSHVLATRLVFTFLPRIIIIIMSYISYAFVLFGLRAGRAVYTSTSATGCGMAYVSYHHITRWVVSLLSPRISHTPWPNTPEMQQRRVGF